MVDAAYKVHTSLGPGLLESAYELALAHELGKRNISIKRQVGIPIRYEDVDLAEGFRADIVVEGKVIIEVKSVDKLMPIHSKQLLTYLRLSGLKLGLLINFNEFFIKNGIHRIVNGLEEN